VLLCDHPYLTRVQGKFRLNNDKETIEAPLPELDERAIAKRYGLRELNYPDSDQTRALMAFLSGAVDTGRCGPVPKTAVMVILDFMQATINRQNITKGPRMSQEEFDVLQTPYYLAARIVNKIQRNRQTAAKERGKTYQQTYLSLYQFIELLRSILDPTCYWLRMKKIPESITESMEALREFLSLYPEQRRKGRAV
jgi:hypothetical protein